MVVTEVLSQYAECPTHVSGVDERVQFVWQDLPGAVDDVHLSQMTQLLKEGGVEKEREVGGREREGEGREGGEDQMKIAWRYQNLPKVQVKMLYVAL